MFKPHITIRECLVAPMESIPVHIADLIYTHHMVPQSIVRESLMKPVYCSDHSCYRPKIWERAKGRHPASEGGEREKWSEHTFYEGSKGAFDGSASNTLRYAELLIDLTDYKRLTFYPDKGFIHCDYAADNLQLFINSNGWQFHEDTNEWLNLVSVLGSNE